MTTVLCRESADAAGQETIPVTIPVTMPDADIPSSAFTNRTRFPRYAGTCFARVGPATMLGSHRERAVCRAALIRLSSC